MTTTRRPWVFVTADFAGGPFDGEERPVGTHADRIEIPLDGYEQKAVYRLGPSHLQTDERRLFVFSGTRPVREEFAEI